MKQGSSAHKTSGLTVAPLQTQTEVLESIADEDAPMKTVHGETEPRMTEVNQQTPIIPAGFRTDQQSFRANLQTVMNLQPCGEYC